MSALVRDVMTSPAVVISSLATFKQAAARLRERRVGALPVVDAEGRVIGVVSEADLVAKEAEPIEGRGTRGRRRTVGDVMTRPALTVTPETSVRAAARTLARRHLRRLPVVDREGHAVGVVSRADVLKIYLRSDEILKEEVLAFVAGDMGIDVSRLDIAVDAGIVGISGEVAERAQAVALMRVVPYLDGVVGVDAHITCRADDPPTARVGDAWPPLR